MTEDELKSKIIFALKGPILQQGFEIICKKNEEFKLKINSLFSDFDSLKHEVNNV